ncbi:MAG TPA: DUF885 domain-containing protein, partial [Bryobacteraceae bacterium]|nr:DUF885 domain-containing protein [Bryobacteraceae bacterium]
MRLVALIACSLFLTSCAKDAPPEPFSQLAEQFVYTSLSFSPVAATQVGYHTHNNVNLDSELDDYSPRSIAAQRRWYQDFRLRLERSQRAAQLSAEDKADYDIIQDQISLALLEIDGIQNYRHNPTAYVELAGNAVYTPFLLEYTDKPKRFSQIISRLRKLPALLEQARGNLVSSPAIWTKVAQQENEGNIALIDQELRSAAPPELRSEYDAAAKPALAALKSFNEYLKNELSQRSYDWQLGRNKYNQKFRYMLATDQSPDQILVGAEAEMKRVRERMLQLCLPFYQKLHPNAAGTPELNTVVSEVLTSIAQKHATPETYFSDARRDLEEAKQFVRSKDLLTLPARDNLQVIETPGFMRGIYGVGGFNAAPALEPQLGAFYWITPIPKEWPAARVESKLREYNYYGLKLLTIHEAMPGHYVQLEYANDIQPPLRRILRAVFGNGPYVEGWAVYATQLMLDEGYLDNSMELQLTFLKQQLRMLANTILDVRMQTLGMTDQQAMDLMVKQGFQENEEATAKLQRAKLSSTQ